MDVHLILARMRHISDAAHIVGEAVLMNYPVRLWKRQQQHTEAVMREFQLLRGGHEDGLTTEPPQLLSDVLDLFTSAFGPLIDDVEKARQHALDAGLDRIDSWVPLIHRAPDLLDDLRLVWGAVDDYCARGELLTCPRDPELVALWNWTYDELCAQYYGADPTPWAGPFRRVDSLSG